IVGSERFAVVPLHSIPDFEGVRQMISRNIRWRLRKERLRQVPVLCAVPHQKFIYLRVVDAAHDIASGCLLTDEGIQVVGIRFSAHNHPVALDRLPDIGPALFGGWARAAASGEKSEGQK